MKNNVIKILLILVAIAVIVFFGVKNRDEKDVLEEAGEINESKSQDWWVNSGALMKMVPTGGSTNIGSLPENSKWQKVYQEANATDTDNGFYPQNIFRLLTRATWQNFEEQAYFTIHTLNKSESPNRNDSNAILFFSRYKDSDNLYYAGIRVDGYSVIKKKINGIYSVLDERQLFPDKAAYDRENNSMLIPLKRPIGLRFETVTRKNGNVHLRLFADIGKTGIWTLVAEADDRPLSSAAPLYEAGFGGVRTDFMDVSFEEISFKQVSSLE